MTSPLHPHHLALIKIFKDNQDIAGNNAWVQKYLGTTKTYFGLKTGIKVKLVKNYFKANSLNFDQYQKLLLSLSRGSSFEELSTVGTLLGNYPQFRRQLDPAFVDKLFDKVEGWAETDVTSTFSADDILDNFPAWEKLLNQFVGHQNIHKRRASIVLLTAPLRQSPDQRLINLALKFVNRLKSENHILITKAISWVLRSAVKHHSSLVSKYLDKNLDTLPKIAIRETKNKLLTGKKSAKIKL